ncbi:class I tRNA ligase family protein, partial [uncultured Cobetia sp.]
EFIWNEYCDWYLELSKPVLWDDNASIEAKRGTRRTLVRALETILRLIHPMMPFISEEIWQRIAPHAGKPVEGESIMSQAWPQAEADRIDEQAIRDIEWLKGIIIAIRNVRGELNLSPAKPLEVFLQNGAAGDAERLEANRLFLSKLARLESITFLAAGDEAPMSAIQRVGELEVLVPMAGLIDKEAELKRIDKEHEKQQKVITGLENKLGNEKFVGRAPADVVEKERAKLADAQAELALLESQRVKIEAL